MKTGILAALLFALSVAACGEYPQARRDREQREDLARFDEAREAKRDRTASAWQIDPKDCEVVIAAGKHVCKRRVADEVRP